MRNIVEHGQTSGSSDDDRQLGVLGRQALHHVDLGADAEHRTGRRASTQSRMRSVEPDPVGELDDVVRALGVHDHLDRRGARRGTRRRARDGSAGAPSSGPSRAAGSPP